jgi:hypothetical protein
VEDEVFRRVHSSTHEFSLHLLSMPKKTLKLRFNTENTGTLFWRALIDGEEHLADHVELKVPSYTSQDTLPDGRIKWHISADYTELVWEGTTLIVK